MTSMTMSTCPVTTTAALAAPYEPGGPAGRVVGGVDTHGHTHHAAVVDHLGRHLGDREFATTTRGYRALLAWLAGHGEIALVGVEGTGAYGAGLARHLHDAGVRVVEVDRPDRRTRRARGKSDPIDAYAAARAALAGTATGTPKTRDGLAEQVRVLRVARRSAIKARTQTINALKAVVVTAPDVLRADLRALPNPALVKTCARLRPGPTGPSSCDDDEGVLAATKTTLRSLARRHEHLSAEVADLDRALAPLVAAAAPRLLQLQGVGDVVAATLLTAAGDNPERLRSEASFAHLCGVAPLPASSGRTDRHRLDTGGNREANNALHTIALCRLRHDERTKAYAARRRAEGLSKKDILRCLKRFIARDVYKALIADRTARQDALQAA